MAELPKYLGYSFQDNSVSDEILQLIVSKIVGEEPNALVDDVDGKEIDYYLVSIENKDNQELLELLQNQGAYIFTCFFDMEAEDGEFVDKQEFVVPELAESDSEEEISTDTDNFIYDTLKLELDTDIFKNVNNAEDSEFFETFEKEQSGISMQYNRLTKDIVAYENDNIIQLAVRVEEQLKDSAVYQKLKEQESGIEILKENQRDKLEELEEEHNSKKRQLGDSLTNLITSGADSKDIAIAQSELKKLSERYEEQKEDLLARQKETLKGNEAEVKKVKSELVVEIVDIADELSFYDFKAVYGYEQRYLETRDYVKEYFSIDKVKEREEAEKRQALKQQKLEEEKQRIAEEEQRRQIEEEERRLREEFERQQQEELESTEQELEEVEETEEDVSVSKNLNFAESLSQAVQGSRKQPSQHIGRTDKEEELSFEDIDSNDTIQRKGKVLEDNLLEQVVDTDEEESTPKMSIFKKHKVAIILGAIGVLGLGYVSFSLGNSGNSKATIEQAKVHKSSKKSESQTSSSSKVSGNKLSDTLYRENVAILADSNLGMYLDDDNNLTGTLKVKDSKGNIVLRYVKEYTQYGQLITTDKDGKEIVYSKKWVDSFIEQIAKAKTTVESSN